MSQQMQEPHPGQGLRGLSQELPPANGFALFGAPARDEDAEGLASTLRACAVAEIERRALLLRLSRLPPSLVRPAHRQRARVALEPLLSADRAQLFRLADGSMAVIWRGAANERLDHAMRSLKLLFADLPQGVAERAELITLLDLPRDNDELLQAIEESLAALPRTRAAARTLPTQPLDIAALAGLELALSQADVAHFVRRKAICSIAADQSMRLRWEKRYLSITELAAALVPEYNPQADRWLFRRLTRTLDRRMLALLSHADELRQAGPFALNMNAASILSPHFLRFDAALPVALRGEVVLELLAADVLADPDMFIFARDFARARGYRLLLRDMTADLLAVFPLDQLGFDMVQLRWSDELETVSDAALRDAVGEPDRIVLGRVAGRNAIDWARRHRIGLFMGPLVTPGAKPDEGRLRPLHSDILLSATP